MKESEILTYKVEKTNCPDCGSLVFLRYDSKEVGNDSGEIRCHRCNGIVISWVQGDRKYFTDNPAAGMSDHDFDKYLNSIIPCPKCGGKLIEKISNRGKFWGCENYPYCKYTSNSNKKV
jgi:ssDNA-binding Zn-finger/Zn-ribbon topoisomerase 1